MRRGARSAFGSVAAPLAGLLGGAWLLVASAHDATACGGPGDLRTYDPGGVSGGGPGGPAFIGLGTLAGGAFSLANAVTPDGNVVVGYSDSPAGTQAFRWTEFGGMVSLGDLPGGAVTSVATSVSTNGNVVVGWSASANGPEEAFRWTSSGGMVGLGDLPGGPFASRATDTSSNGQVVVGFTMTGEAALEAFRWTLGGAMIGLGDLPGGQLASRAMSVSGDGQYVTGWGNSGNIGVNEAFLWSPLLGMQGLGFIAGSLNQGTQGVGISFDGRTVVGQGWAGIGVEAFRWRVETGYVTLGDLPGGTIQPFSTAYAVSADGETIVGAGSTALGSEAFIWTQSEGMQHLGQLLESIGADLSGWVLKEARGVSVDGKVVVGVGTHNGADEAWLASLSMPCPADLNGDGTVNVQDTLILLAIPYGPCSNCTSCPGDVNGDCTVGTADLLAQFAVFGSCR